MSGSHWSLGISLSHDASAALCADGRVVVAVASERLCRRKHGFPPVKRYHFELPWDAVCYCLDAAGVGLDDLQRIVLNKAGGAWDWRREDLCRTLPVRQKRKIVCLQTHHDAHALYAYHASGWQEATVIVADRFGSFVPKRGYESESGYRAEGGCWEKVFANYLDLPATRYGPFHAEHSLTALYQIVTLHYGFFQEMDQCGKTMGWAAYGRPRGELPEWVRVGADFSVDCRGFYEEMIARGVIRTEDLAPLSFSGHTLARVPRHDYRTRSAELAAQAQFEVETAMCQLVRQLVRQTGVGSVCAAGGLFHNSALNGKLLAVEGVERLFVPPAASDDGNAVGCAYYGCQLDGVPCRPLSHAFLGRSYSEAEILRSLERAKLVWQRRDRQRLLAETAALLAAGSVLAWFQGGSEFGFRALGHRSILADPRDPGVRDYINGRVKYREPFRPLAAAVLAEQVGGWFSPAVELPYMTAVTRSLCPERVPAVTHVDGSSRVQTVAGPGLFRDLLEHFFRRTGVPLLLNTSFNAPGQPIVETPDDAVHSFLAMRLDHLVIGPFLIQRPGA